MTTVYDGFYLLDHHRNRDKPSGPAGEYDTRPWYTTRNRCHHGHNRPHLLVIHDPETLEDFTAPYDEAERVARYGATTTRASWHDSIDADSIIPMLPASYTAWHVRGFNRCGIGMEVGAMADSWDQAPAAWLEGVMANTAIRAAQHMAAYDIPPTLLFEPGKRYTTSLDPSGFGLISHHALDPTRRTDPGFTFPWDDLLIRLDSPMAFTPQEEHELKAFVAEVLGAGSNMGFIPYLIADIRKGIVTADELGRAEARIRDLEREVSLQANEIEALKGQAGAGEHHHDSIYPRLGRSYRIG